MPLADHHDARYWQARAGVLLDVVKDNYRELDEQKEFITELRNRAAGHACLKLAAATQRLEQQLAAATTEAQRNAESLQQRLSAE